jgi:outer membrane protein TolC
MFKIITNPSYQITIAMLIFSCIFPMTVNSQNKLSTRDTSHLDLDLLDYVPDLQNSLLPLDSIIELTLENSPSLKKDEKQSEKFKHFVRVEKWKNLNYLAPVFQYSQGNQAYLFPGLTGVGSGGSIFNGYRYGINVSIPLGDVFSNGSQIKALKAEQKSSEHKEQETILLVMKQVVDLYTKLITAQRILKIRLTNKESSATSYELAETKFKNGTIGLEEWIKVGEIYAESESKYEITRGEFINAYYQFEYFVGFPMKDLLKKRP